MTRSSHPTTYYNIDDGVAVKCRCKLCDKCYLFIDGSKAGTCLYGGPYEGLEWEPKYSSDEKVKG